jgi:hypothetical protein
MSFNQQRHGSFPVSALAWLITMTRLDDFLRVSVRSWNDLMA